MKLLALTILVVLVISTILSGCANKAAPIEEAKPLPYKVIKKQYQQVRRINFKTYELGITQEKVTESHYVITVKLDKPNTIVQAKEMALYYGALLAKEHGARKFSIGNRGQGYWCQPNPSNPKDRKTSNFGGSAFKFHLNLIKFPKSKRLPLLVMNTNKTIKVLGNKVYNKASESAWAQVEQVQPKLCKNRTSYQNVSNPF